MRKVHKNLLRKSIRDPPFYDKSPDVFWTFIKIRAHRKFGASWQLCAACLLSACPVHVTNFLFSQTFKLLKQYGREKKRKKLEFKYGLWNNAKD